MHSSSTIGGKELMRRIVGAVACLSAAIGIAALSAGTASAGVRITGGGVGEASEQANERSLPSSSIFGVKGDTAKLGRDF